MLCPHIITTVSTGILIKNDVSQSACLSVFVCVILQEYIKLWDFLYKNYFKNHIHCKAKGMYLARVSVK